MEKQINNSIINIAEIELGVLGYNLKQFEEEAVYENDVVFEVNNETEIDAPYGESFYSKKLNEDGTISKKNHKIKIYAGHLKNNIIYVNIYIYISSIRNVDILY